MSIFKGEAGRNVKLYVYFENNCQLKQLEDKNILILNILDKYEEVYL